MAIFRISIGITAALAIFVGGQFPAPADDGFSEADREAALEQIRRLEADDFVQREAAVATLKALPEASLPWLEDLVEARGKEDSELGIRLRSILHTVEGRELERELREGTRVEIDLKAAKPGAVLEALKKESGFSLTSLTARSIWEDEPEKDFVFEGAFWDAVDAMLDAYPPKEGERENLGDDYRLGRWGAPDFGAVESPSVTSGILRVRHGRMALENIGGKDYLIVTLVPSVEPNYELASLSLLVKGLTLEDGEVVEPEEAICAWESKNSGTAFVPTGVFTWTFPLKKGVNLRGNAKLEGIAKLEVGRLDWVEVEMPGEVNSPVGMTQDVQLNVVDRDETTLTVRFEGTGRKPAWAVDFGLRKEGYQLLDKDGEVLDFKVRRGSGGSGDKWSTSHSGTIEGEPVRLRAKLAGQEKEVQLEFELPDLPMPGSSLVD